MDPLEGYGIEQAKSKGELRTLQPAIDQAALTHKMWAFAEADKLDMANMLGWTLPTRPEEDIGGDFICQVRSLAAPISDVFVAYDLWFIVRFPLVPISNLSSLYSSLARRATLLIYTSDEHESHLASGFFGWDIWFESDW